MLHAVLVLLVFVVLGGCNATGISIEVHRGTTDADRVELYVVDDHCVVEGTEDRNCPRLKTPSSRDYLENGEIYTRKYSAPFMADVDDDGVAYFKLIPSENKNYVPLMVAVGFRGDVQVGAVLLSEINEPAQAERRIVTLEGLIGTAVDGTVAMQDGLRAELWYQQSGERAGCLAFERWKGGQREFLKFIVPADDLDCDDWVAPQECDAVYPNRPADAGQIFPAGCVVEESSGPMQRCLLGTSDCVDGDGAAACETDPQQILCAPSRLCELCGDSTVPWCSYTHLKHPDPATTRVHCKIPVNVDENMQRICDNTVTTPLLPFNTVGQMATCLKVDIGPVTSTQLGPFVRSIANVMLSDVVAPCSVDLTVQGSFPLTATDALPDHVLKLQLDNGVSLIVPVEFELVRPAGGLTCLDLQPSCELLPVTNDPSLLACGSDANF